MAVCHRCEQRPAVACDECGRALAFLDHPAGFGSIARHPDAGVDCRLCEQGGAELCVECLCESVLEARAAPDSPYTAPSVKDFEAQGQRAAADHERVLSMYDRTPADRGPSWYRLIGGGQ